MILVRSRLGFVVACLAAAFICWAVVYLPPYEKIVYANSPVLSQEEVDERRTRSKGYRGDEDIQRVQCIDDMSDERRNINVVLEINSENLKATGIYRCTEEGDLPTLEYNKIKVFFLRTIKSYGQYYIATLESGENFPILVDDSLVKVKKKENIQLPIGRKDVIPSIDFQKYNVSSPYEHSYLDCATSFATGVEMQDFRFMEIIATVILVVAMIVVLVIVCGINFGKSLK